MEPVSLDDVPISSWVHPESSDAVAQMLEAARADRVPIVARGGGSKLHWGNRSDASELRGVDLAALDGTLNLDADEGIVTVSAGVRVEVLARAAAKSGRQTLLCDLYAGASVGGTIAADPIGFDFAHDRRLRDDVLGLQVAHPNGTLTRCGGRVVKNVTGFDLVRLYCGSFGTLGVITEATLRLRPLPEVRAHRQRDFTTQDEALAFTGELAALAPRRVLLLPNGKVWRVLWELEGGEGDVRQRVGSVEGASVETDELDALTRTLVESAGRRPELARVRLAARPSDTRSLGEAVIALAGRTAFRLALPQVGIVLADVPGDTLESIFEYAQHEHWLLFVETATPARKNELDVFGPAPEGLSLMRTLKQRFDPERVLAPGRFVGRI